MNWNKLTVGCLAILTIATASAADPSPKPTGDTATAKPASAGSGVQEIDIYVREVEKSASKLTRKEAMLSPDALKSVTDEKWTKVHTYSDGAKLKRMKVYPAAGSQKTEEFYYRNDQPVFVFVEANGAGKENHDANAKGDKYYFANGSLVAAMHSDGKTMDVNSADAKKMADKLKKEAQAFRAAAK